MTRADVERACAEHHRLVQAGERPLFPVGLSGNPEPRRTRNGYSWGSINVRRQAIENREAKAAKRKKR